MPIGAQKFVSLFYNISNNYLLLLMVIVLILINNFTILISNWNVISNVIITYVSKYLID